jgi:hypothetical protein
MSTDGLQASRCGREHDMDAVAEPQERIAFMVRTIKIAPIVRVCALTLTVVTALALGCAGMAAAAGGAHTQSFTETFHGTLTNELNEKRALEEGEEYEPPINPCTGKELQVVEETNLVNHITFFPASDEVWATFTQTSGVTATEEGTSVTYSGRTTFWGNFNVNRQNENSTFTGTIRLKGSDGSTISFHVVDHFTLLPGGKVAVEFAKPRLTCG